MLRTIVDQGYSFIKHPLYAATSSNPKNAHSFAFNLLHLTNKIGMIEHFKAPAKQHDIRIANAAGFDKDADLTPEIVTALGFDVHVIGTVTADYWSGNEHPRLKRFVPKNDLMNREGLPGIGCEAIADKLVHIPRVFPGYHRRINVMSTPQKGLDESLEDVATTYRTLRPFAHSWELNLACPNTDHSPEETAKQAKLYVDIFDLEKDDVYVKLSPDLELDDLYAMLDSCKGVKGFITSNTSLQHNNHFPNGAKGGLSGRSLYPLARKIQEDVDWWMDKYMPEKELIAVGGIDSVRKAKERITDSPRVKEIQLYTGLIYKGPKLLSQLRQMEL